MKKVLCLVLPLLLVFTPVALGSPNFTGETIVISFRPDMTGIVPDPAGQWMDELIAMISIRAERMAWPDGSLCEYVFLVSGTDACSLGILRLEEKSYACGSLVPEGPVALTHQQAQVANAWSEALFPSKADVGINQVISVDVPALAAGLHETARICRSLKANPEDENALEAVAILFSELSIALTGNGEDQVILRVDQVARDNVYGYIEPEVDEGASDDLANTLVTRFIEAMVEAIIGMGEQ